MENFSRFVLFFILYLHPINGLSYENHKRYKTLIFCPRTKRTLSLSPLTPFQEGAYLSLRMKINKTIKMPCKTHKHVGPDGYIERSFWAAKRHKNGMRQKQCTTCKYWFWKDEM